jgi:hypothetical protein
MDAQIAYSTAMQRGFGSVPQGVGSNMYVFETKPIEQKAASKEAGRPIYKEVDFIKIFSPGQKDYVIHEVTDRIFLSHPQAKELYKRYKDGAAAPQEGTPLEEWPPISRAIAYELKALNIHTVENLAHAADAVTKQFGPNAYSLKEQAKEYLKAAEDSKHVTKMAAENQKLKEQIEMQAKQLQELSDKFDELESKKKTSKKS